MNDFTKEELEELWFFTELHKNKYRLKYPEELLRKLQSMIDSYCEHQQRVASTTEEGCMVVQCGRCDVVLWHEKD